MYRYQQHEQQQEYQLKQQRQPSQGGYPPNRSINTSSFFNSKPNPVSNVPQLPQGHHRHPSRPPPHAGTGNESLSTITNRTNDCRGLHPGVTHTDSTVARMNHTIPSTIQVSNATRTMSEGTVGTFASANASQFFSQTISTVNEDGSQVSHSSRQHQEQATPALDTAVNLFSKTASALYHTTAAAVNAAETVGERVGTLRSDFVKMAAPMPPAAAGADNLSRNGPKDMTSAKSFFGGNVAGGAQLGNKNVFNSGREIGGAPFAKPSPGRTVTSAAEMFQQSSFDTVASGSNEPHNMETVNLFGTMPPSSVRAPSPMSFVRDSSPASSVRDISPVPATKSNATNVNVSASSFFAPSNGDSHSIRRANTPVRTTAEIFGQSATPVRQHSDSPSMPSVPGNFGQNGATSKDSSHSSKLFESQPDGNGMIREDDVGKQSSAPATPNEKLSSTLTPSKGDSTQSLKQVGNLPRPPPSRLEASPALSTKNQFPKPPVLPAKSSSTPTRNEPKTETSDPPMKSSTPMITPKSTPVVSKPLPTFPKPRLPSPAPRRPKAPSTPEQRKINLPLPEKKALPLPQPMKKSNDTEHVLEKKDITAVGKESGKSNFSVASGSARSVKSSREGLFRVPPPLQITASPLPKRNGVGMPSPLPSPISVSKKTSDHSSSPEKQPIAESVGKSPISPAIDSKPASIEFKETSILPPLPDGWIELTTPDTGIKYYLNPSTRETSWERPVIKSSKSSDELQPPLATKGESILNVSSERKNTTNENQANSHEQIVKNVAEKFVMEAFHDADKESKSDTTDNNVAPMKHFASVQETEAEKHDILSETILPGRDHHQPIESAKQRLGQGVLTDTSRTDSTIKTKINIDAAPLVELLNQDMKNVHTSHDLDSERISSKYLREGWVEMIDESSGRPYFFHEKENKTQWERPTENHVKDEDIQQKFDVTNLHDANIYSPDKSNDLATESLPNDWIEMIDESSGKPFYYNQMANVTQWERPKVLHEKNIETHLIPDTATMHSYDDIMSMPEGVKRPTDGDQAGNENTNFVNKADSSVVQEPPDYTDDTKRKASNDGGKVLHIDERNLQRNLPPSSNEGKEENVEDCVQQTDKNTTALPLPEGWVEMIDESSGMPYYFNEKENVTQWERPEMDSGGRDDGDGINNEAPSSATDSMPADNAPVVEQHTKHIGSDAVKVVEPDEHVTGADEGGSTHVLPDGWVEMIDESSGLPYYFNELENTTQWERPGLSDGKDNVPIEETDDVGRSSMADATSQLGTDGVADIDANKKSDDNEDATALPLPEGWVEMIDESSGMPYYFNEKENVTQWERPEMDSGGRDDGDGINNEAPSSATDSMHATIDGHSLPPGWVKLKDSSSGRIYYYNELDNITQWELPTILRRKNHTRHDLTSSRSRPGHAIAVFGFGGRLCVMKPQLADNLGYATSQSKAILRKGPVEIHRLGDIISSDHIPFRSGCGMFSLEKPFSLCSDNEVMEYLEKKSGLYSSDDELLWNLVLVAARWKGCLRSVDGVSNPNGPEAGVVELLLSRKSSQLSTSLLSGFDGSSALSSDSMVADIQRHLIRGEREEAVKCALSGDNYALALLIASLCGHQTYYTTARYFIEKTLVPGTPLHTAAILFANQIQSTEEIDDQATDLWSNGTGELEANWHHHLATILSNQGRGWKRIVTALGDCLLTRNIYAAHFCYLVCGRPIMPPSDPSSRLVLIGCDHTNQLNAALATKESCEAYLRTEALEWAKRKGNPNAVITALQPFKLQYAILLADYGFESVAKIYVDSLRKCTGLNAPFNHSKGNSTKHGKMYPQDFEDSLNIFEDRLSVSLGLKSCDSGSNHSNKFALGNVLSKIMKKTEREGDQFHDPVYTDACFDEINDVSAEDANMTFVSASSNILDTVTTPSTTAKSAHPKYQPLSSGQKRPNRALMSTVKETYGDSLSQEVQPEALYVSMNSPANIKAERPGPTPVPTLPNLDGNNVVKPLQSKPMGNMERSVTKQVEKEVIEEAPRSNPINLTKSAASTPVDRKIKKEAPSSGSSWSVRGWLTKKLNPDATEADVGDAMEAYYDEKLKRWIFPGDDPNEVAKPLAPPPTTPVVKHEMGPVSTPNLSSNDPLSMMMAPPSRSTPKTDPLSNLVAPPSRSTPSNVLKGPPAVPRSTISQVKHGQSLGTNVGQAPPQFVIFKPSKKDET